MAKKRKRLAGRTKDRPVRPKQKRHIRFSYMHVRSVLYRNYKIRYKTWESTRLDAKQIIADMKASGYTRATKTGVLRKAAEYSRLIAEAQREQVRKPEDIRELFAHHQQMLNPIPFFQVTNDLCYPWSRVSNKLILWTKYIWKSGTKYRGGAVIPYEETFADYTRAMAEQQQEKRERVAPSTYENDWYFLLRYEEAIWDKEQNAFMVEVVTSNSEGERTYYFDEKEKDMPVGPSEGKPIERGKPKEEVPPPPPAAPPAPPEISPEQRVEIEKEKVRATAEAEAKAKSEVKIKALESAERMLKEGTITFDQYMKLIDKIM